MSTALYSLTFAKTDFLLTINVFLNATYATGLNFNSAVITQICNYWSIWNESLGIS